MKYDTEVNVVQLQRRYPAIRDGEECYVKRKCLTTAERLKTVAQLRKEAAAAARHADALEAEMEALIRAGRLDPAS